MKWIATLMVLAVALAPAVLAGNIQSNAVRADSTANSAITADNTNNTDNTTDTENATSEPEATNATNADAGQRFAERARAQREKIMAQKQKLKAQRINVKQKVKKAVKEKSELRKAAEELKACRGRSTEECETKRKEAKEKAQEALVNTAEQAEKLLNKLKDKVTPSEVEGKEGMLLELEERLQLAADAKTAAEKLTEESTKEDYKAVKEDLREALKGVKQFLRKGTYRMLALRLGKAIDATDNLDEKIANIIKKLDEKGIDASTIDLSALEETLSSAGTLHSEAAELAKQAEEAEGDEKATLMQQATEKLRESHKALKNAKDELRNIISQLKELQAESTA